MVKKILFTRLKNIRKKLILAEAADHTEIIHLTIAQVCVFPKRKKHQKSFLLPKKGGIFRFFSYDI